MELLPSHARFGKCVAAAQTVSSLTYSRRPRAAAVLWMPAVARDYWHLAGASLSRPLSASFEIVANFAQRSWPSRICEQLPTPPRQQEPCRPLLLLLLRLLLRHSLLWHPALDRPWRIVMVLATVCGVGSVYVAERLLWDQVWDLSL